VKIDLVIFDLDGTLLDTIGDISDAANSVLEQQLFPTHSEQEYMRMIGPGIVELVTLMLPVHERTSDRIAHSVKLMEYEYSQRLENKTSIYKGIPELLDSLIEAGYKIAILSNKPDKFIVRTVRNLLNKWPFNPTWGVKYGVPRKPDPTAAKALADSLNCPVDRCLFVGDSEVDIQTGYAAGMITVGVTWGFRTRKQLEKVNPDYLIDYPAQLLNLDRKQKENSATLSEDRL